MLENHQETVSCPFCAYQFELMVNVLVVSCLQCLKRFVPDFKKKISKKQDETLQEIFESELKSKDKTSETKTKTPEPKTSTQKPITALPIFVDKEAEPGDDLILTPVQVTSFQTHFESEVNSLLQKPESSDKLLAKGNLEGDSLVGQILFKIEKKIAEGGMGTVYRAKMICADGFEKLVALKTLRPQFAQDIKLLSMFVSEARVMAELKHHNIAAIHSFGKFRGLYFYAMEYIEGRDLYAFQKRHQKMNRVAPIGILVYLIAQVCNALNYIHTKRDNRGKPLELIHRDISPQNIMFSADGVVKVMDFGVAKSKSIAASQKKALAGKLNYTAPEIALFQEVDHRADIYSLGVVFYELVTGRLPFHWKNPVEMNQKIETAEFEPPSKYFPSIPEEIERVILKAMAKKLNQRWADAATMGFALNRYLYSKGMLFNERSLSDYLKGIFVNWGQSGIATTQQEDRVDMELVQAVMEQKLVDRNQLTECLKAQAEYNLRGEYMNLGALLVMSQYITIEQFQMFLKSQNIDVMRCPTCGNQYYVAISKIHSNKDCLRCASALQVPEKLDSALVDGQLLDD
ncbi:MAG: serine/threonine-protein kinase [Planctomycetota bacterium]